MQCSYPEKESALSGADLSRLPRSASARCRALTRMGFRTPRESRLPWTEAEIGRLVEMRKEGMSAQKISESGEFSKSLNAIRTKLGRMGLVKSYPIVKFNARQREELRRFLRDNWENKTPQELADLWNSSKPYEHISKRRVISYLSDLGIKIHYGEVNSMNAARRREEKIKSSGKSANEMAELIRTSRSIIMERRMRLGRDIWTGMPLPAETDMDE
jgi:hypothetical protein